jgi:hypothetical protein
MMQSQVMNIKDLLKQIEYSPETVDYQQVLSLIEANYHYTPSHFTNGALDNAAGENQISCKILAFALLNGLNQAQTLACFGQLYRDDVLANPNGQGHQNIRQFMQTGWQAVKFSQTVLQMR